MSITKSVQPESIVIAVGRRSTMPLVAEAYVILNGKQLVQSPVILPTTYLACFSLEGNVAPKYLFLSSGRRINSWTYFHQRGINELISRTDKINMSWEGVISAPLYTSFIYHVAV